MNNWPYTNTHELNLDWILQVVKEFQDNYQGINDALDEAIAAINAKKTASTAEMETLKQIILNQLNQAQQASLTAIEGAKLAAVGDINTARQTSVAAVYEESLFGREGIKVETAMSVEKINRLINSLPEDYADIVGKLLIIGGIIQLNTTPLFTWVLGNYNGGTPPSAGLTAASVISTVPMAGGAGLVLDIALDTADTQVISVIRTFTAYDSDTGNYTPGSVITVNSKTASVQIPGTAVYFSVEVKYSDSEENNYHTSDLANTHVKFSWENSITALYDVMDIDTYLINNGVFEFKQSDLLPGVWMYTTATENAKRLRSKMKIPVRAGMVVDYSTQADQVVYIGVADGPDSGSVNFITSGWVTGTGSYKITKTGYMTFNVKANPEVNISTSDYDSVVKLRTVNREELDVALENKYVTADTAAALSNSAENLPINTFSWVLAQWFNDLPEDVQNNDFGWIVTLAPSSRNAGSFPAKTQWFIVPDPASNSYKVFFRRIQYGSMSGWVNTLSLDDVLQNTGILPSGDLNDITGNKAFILVSSNAYDNAPFTIGTIIHMDFSSTLAIQYGFQFGTGNLYYRRKSTTWGAWVLLVPNLDNYRTTGKYVAFGDSLIWGAVWSPTAGTDLHRVDFKWRIPTRISMAAGMLNNVVNAAIGGIGYFKEEGGINLVDQISDYDFTDVELVTIMAGANDHYYTDLGTASDSADATTICGAIRKIIGIISAANPKTQIVIMQPTPCGIDGTQYDVFTSKQGDGYLFRWSLDEFDAQVSQLCRNEHVGYVNWEDSSMCRNWKYSGYNGETGPNHTHPTADIDYCYLGNFIAGKVAALYHGLN